jgi:hypothetical protein
VLGFDAVGEVHAILEARRLPRMPDGTVGRIVLHRSPRTPLESPS